MWYQKLWIAIPITIVIAFFFSLIPIAIWLGIFLLFYFFFTRNNDKNRTTDELREKYRQNAYDTDSYIDYSRVPYQYYEAYKDYLRTREWRSLRLEVLNRDSFSCVKCGTEAIDTPLHVHHIHYRGIETMTFTPDQLITICPSCHKLEHQH